MVGADIGAPRGEEMGVMLSPAGKGEGTTHRASGVTQAMTEQPRRDFLKSLAVAGISCALGGSTCRPKPPLVKIWQLR
jgi:hypothetical protein